MTLRLRTPASLQAALLLLALICGSPLVRADASWDPGGPASAPEIRTSPPDPEPGDSRESIVWLGGGDGNCLAYPGGVWDWDDPAAPELHCWLKTDGSVISVIPQQTWQPWLDAAGIIDCGCCQVGNV